MLTKPHPEISPCTGQIPYGSRPTTYILLLLSEERTHYFTSNSSCHSRSVPDLPNSPKLACRLTIAPATMAVHHIATHAEFESLLKTNMYVVADFFATWCGPCKAIAPMYEGFAKASSIPGYLAFAKVDTDKNQDTARAYNISAMPTFMFFKNGKQVGVNGQPLIRGADVQGLKAAVDKLGDLAKEKQAAGVKVGE